MAVVTFDGVAKTFGAVVALAPTDLTVATGEFLTLLGPSGSGKTTLLNICAGYIEPSAGRIRVDERDVTGLPPRRRDMGMVFQSYALFPHLDVFENVAYGLRVRRRPQAEIARRVEEALAWVRLEGFGARQIAQLSGGQQQRVALARAMVIEPAVLLMDEPLGALDRQLRKEVQLEIRRLHVAKPRTTIYVTHDQEEALVMSDRIAVMRAGGVVQIGSARELYERPVDAFVARFLGESNLLKGIVRRREGERAAIEVEGLPNLLAGRAGRAVEIGSKAVALVRPESVRARAGGFPGKIVERVYLGDIIALRLQLAGGQELWQRRFAGEEPQTDAVEVGWDEDCVSILAEG